MSLTEAQRNQRKLAGANSYRKMTIRIIKQYWPDVDRAAMALSCWRYNHGFKYRRGVTSNYILKIAREEELDGTQVLADVG